MTNTDWKNSSDFTFTTFFPHLHLSHSVSICVVVSSPCAPSDCDAWGQKSTASCLDFNMVLSVLASLKKKKKKRRKTSCTNHTTTRILCPSLLANFVHKLSLVNVAPPPLSPLYPWCNFRCNKKQSSCATWNTFCVRLIWSFWLWSERNDLSETIWLFSPT